MEYSIYTFGNGVILKGIFDSIAMLMNSHSGSLHQPFIRITLIVGAFWAALYVIYGEGVKVFTSWIIPSIGILHLLFLPQATVRIIDTSPITYQDKVSHVPYGLAMFGHYVSLIGKVMTEETEKIFSLPDDLKYHKTGVLFASNIVRQAKTFHITNENMAENMRQFVGQCVVYDAILGVKYTIEDLRNNEDIWKLVSTNPSPVRSFYWRNVQDPSQKPVLVTCKEGVARFNQAWNGLATKAADIFGTKVFGKQLNARAEVIKYLPLSYNLLANSSDQAGKIIQQQMMIHAVVDGIEQKSTALGNAPNFATRRAYLQQRATYETLGTLAADTLPAMKAVFEGLAYAAFLFVLPLSLMPFGYRYLLSWAQILLWLQMWAPLYAVLNFMMTIAVKSKCLAHLSLSNEAGVTIASSVGFTNLNADIASMAGYLAISIPFLSIALVKGVGNFVHMASHLGGVSQSTAQMAAGEAVTGNYSFGNVTEGTRQIYNTQMLQQSSAASYRSGTFHQSDGKYDTITTSDGTQISNVMTPNIPTSVNYSESLSNQYSENASRSFQAGMNLSEAASKTQADSLRKYADLNDHLRSSESISQTNTSSISSEDRAAITKAGQMVEIFSKERGISRGEAADYLAQAGVSGSLGPFSAGTSASLKGTATDSKTLSAAKRFTEEHNLQDTLSKAQQASQHIAHATNDEKTRQLAEGASGSHEKSEHYRSEAGKSFSKAESYQRQASYTRANSASINASLTQQVMDYIADLPADNAPGKMGQHQAAYIAAYKPEVFARYARDYLEKKGLMPHVSNDVSPTSLKQQYEQESIPHNVNQQSISDVKQKGTGVAFDGKQGQKIDQSVEGSIQKAAPKLEEAKAVNAQNQQDLKEQHAQQKEEYLLPQAAAEVGGGIITGVKDILKEGIPFSGLGSNVDSQGERISSEGSLFEKNQESVKSHQANQEETSATYQSTVPSHQESVGETGGNNFLDQKAGIGERNHEERTPRVANEHSATQQGMTRTIDTNNVSHENVFQGQSEHTLTSQNQQGISSDTQSFKSIALNGKVNSEGSTAVQEKAMRSISTENMDTEESKLGHKTHSLDAGSKHPAIQTKEIIGENAYSLRRPVESQQHFVESVNDSSGVHRDDVVTKSRDEKRATELSDSTYFKPRNEHLDITKPTGDVGSPLGEAVYGTTNTLQEARTEDAVSKQHPALTQDISIVSQNSSAKNGELDLPKSEPHVERDFHGEDYKDSLEKSKPVIPQAVKAGGKDRQAQLVNRSVRNHPEGLKELDKEKFSSDSNKNLREKPQIINRNSSGESRTKK